MQRDHAGKLDKMLTPCKTMKAIREKSQHEQGLQEADPLASIENARKEIENSFSRLELKGKKVKTFLPTRNSREVVDALKDIDPTITADQLIPYSRSKLKKFPSLQRYFDRHLAEGLYLLQFRKCNEKNCCTIKNHPLLPLIPAPVMAPDGEHYLAFDDLYGKVQTTEKDCPSLRVKVSQKKKDNSSFKFISSRVVAVLECSLCRKLCCVFNMNSIITVDGQRELDDIIFSCGAILNSKSLYMARHLKCASPVENAYH